MKKVLICQNISKTDTEGYTGMRGVPLWNNVITTLETFKIPAQISPYTPPFIWNSVSLKA